jgi:hypothetical protein
VHNTGGRGPWLALTASLVWAGIAQAQAWLPSAGSGDVSLSYVDSWYTKHWLANGGTLDAGHIRAYTYALGAEYSPTDRWMFSASLPLVESEYHGARPHPTYVDDGSYHATITDLRMEAHYQWLLQPFAIAPYVAYVLPTHDYETLGHAAPGRDLDETWVGVALGKSLDHWIPRTYVDARFTYAFVQAVHGVSHDKENVEFDLGYFITHYLSVQGMWHWQQTLGGIDIPATNALFPYHDQLARDNHTNVGGSIAWAYSDHSSFSLSYLNGIMGRNGHKVDDTFALTYDYQFGNR